MEMEHISKVLMTNKLKERIGFHYLLRDISFGIQYIPQEVLHKIKDKSITYNMFRI